MPWVTVNTSQTAGWVLVNDSQTPNWQTIVT
jgi:hypothetical protein